MAEALQTEKLEVIIGRSGIERLARARVMVLGVGGVGSNCVEALARGGVGNLVIVDRDTVAASNINRQAIAFHSTIGQRKVDVMEHMVHDINPAAHVETHGDFLRAETLPAFLEPYRGSIDWVVDAIDTVSAKLALAAYADSTGLPLVSSMGSGNKLHPGFFRFADVYDTVNCPLCRIMRKECRKRGIRALQVLYSCEQPARTSTVEGTTRRDRSDLGTMSYIPPIMGQMLAGWIIRRILRIDEDDQERRMSAPSSDADEKAQVHASTAAAAPDARRAQGGMPPQYGAPHMQGAAALLHDAHCHLNFAPNGEDAARLALEAGTLLLNVTVTPEEHARARTRFATFSNVRTGLGFHPWWVESGASGTVSGKAPSPSTPPSLDLFLEELENERFIGEVGLDFAPMHERTRDAQIETFQTICGRASTLGNRVLSIHAVRSAGTALDILESSGALDTCTCIFHWFSGTSDELARAVKRGCLFSVGQRMATTKRGRAYLRAIPLDRLLLETDLPARKGESIAYDRIKDALSAALGSIVAEKGEGAAESVDATMRRVFGLVQ